MKEKKYNILFAMIFGALAAWRIITFFEGMLLYLLIYSLADISAQIAIIREQLEKLNYPPFHANCRHEITPYFDDKEAE